MMTPACSSATTAYCFTSSTSSILSDISPAKYNYRRDTFLIINIKSMKKQDEAGNLQPTLTTSSSESSTKLPLNRIKKIMQANKEIGKI